MDLTIGPDLEKSPYGAANSAHQNQPSHRIWVYTISSVPWQNQLNLTPATN